MLLLWEPIEGGMHGNLPEIQGYLKALKENNISFQHRLSINQDLNIQLAQNLYMAPAIQGKWQIENGYIPCRIFKNISYGAWGITNSKIVWELFDKKITYNDNSYLLFYDAQKKIQTLQKDELFELMDFVKEKHTYLNRINHLLTFFELVQQTHNN